MSVVELDEVWGLFNEVVRQGGCMLVDMYMDMDMVVVVVQIYYCLVSVRVSRSKPVVCVELLPLTHQPTVYHTGY